jgi:hypothetical protein
MTDSSFSPADAEGLAAWFTRAEANAAGLRRRLRDFDTDQRPPHQPRQKDSCSVVDDDAGSSWRLS